MRAKSRRAELRVAALECATAAVGTIEPGMRVLAVTKGQFSLQDLLGAVLAQTGPAHVKVSTWTAGLRDIENAALLIESGEILSLSLLVDKSLAQRQPKYVARLQELFGEGVVSVSYIHAKFALVWNDAWSLCIRTSMNLNHNPRTEYFEIDDDREMLEWFLQLCDEIEGAAPGGLDADGQAVYDGFHRMLNHRTVGGEAAKSTAPDERARARELGELQMTAADVAVALGVDVLEGELLAAYRSGRVSGIEKARRVVFNVATGGEVESARAVETWAAETADEERRAARPRRASR